MPFIIPNATDTTSGNRYAALDQAEPDSLDFEILGNSASGVMDGCAVEATVPASTSVFVNSGQVVINNLTYSVTSQTLNLNSAPASNRFDLVVARVSNAITVTLVVVSGSESLSNPTYPKSWSRLNSGEVAGATTHINPDTDVVLAAVYRVGGTAVTNAYIVDKRAAVRSNIAFQGASAPANTLGVAGDLYYRTSGRVSSGVYVKHGDNTWDELVKYPLEPGVPIGSVIMWPALGDPNLAVWVEATGAAVSRTTYADLFAVLGTTYGAGDGSTTFNLPDFRGHYLAGLPTTGGALGVAAGNSNSEVTLVTNNLPVHTHALGDAATVSQAPAHSHGVNLFTTSTNSGINNDTHTHGFSGTVSETTVLSSQSSGATVGTSTGYQTSNTLTTANLQTNNLAHSHSFSGTTASNDTSHTHNIPALAVTGSTLEAGSHGHTLSGTTAPTGGGAPVSVAPATFYMRFFLRYA